MKFTVSYKILDSSTEKVLNEGAVEHDDSFDTKDLLLLIHQKRYLSTGNIIVIGEERFLVEKGGWCFYYFS